MQQWNRLQEVENSDMKKIIIIGASGHGKVVADIAKRNGYGEILFLDDNEKIDECGGYKVIGKVNDFIYHDCDMIVAIGDAKIRKRIQNLLEQQQKSIVTLIHPNAVIGECVSIGMGAVVMAGAVVNPHTEIGKGCIINTCSSVDHDNIIGDYVHISVGAHIAGSVKICNEVWIGVGAAIINNISVESECIIGAGAVVICDIKEPGTYVGVPAKRVNR